VFKRPLRDLATIAIAKFVLKPNAIVDIKDPINPHSSIFSQSKEKTKKNKEEKKRKEQKRKGKERKEKKRKEKKRKEKKRKEKKRTEENRRKNKLKYKNLQKSLYEAKEMWILVAGPSYLKAYPTKS
jgi:hypothetical protein